MILSIFSRPLMSTGIRTKRGRASNKPTLTTRISSHPISSGLSSCDEEVNVFPIILSGTSTGGKHLESSDLALTLFTSTQPILEYGINNISIAVDLAASILKDELERADQKSLRFLDYETVARTIAADVVSNIAADEDSESSLHAVRKIVCEKNIKKYKDQIKKEKFLNMPLVEHKKTEELYINCNRIKSEANKDALQMGDFDESDKMVLNTAEDILDIGDHVIETTLSESFSFSQEKSKEPTFKVALENASLSLEKSKKFLKIGLGNAGNNSGKVSKGTVSKGKKNIGKEVWKKGKRSISSSAKSIKVTFNKTNSVAPNHN